MKYLLYKVQNIENIISKHSSIIVLAICILINLYIYNQFWQELSFDRSSVNAVHGEITAIEWYTEGVYQNIIGGKNPFAESKGLFHPFGTNFVSAEAGFGFYFIFTRPFLSTHQSLYVLAALSIVAANIGMYLLLRHLKVSRSVSLLIGLMFGYMTFIQPRMGHLTYLTIYVFPWFYLSGLKMLFVQNKLIKTICSILTAFFFTMALYHNMYYFVMLVLSLGLFIVYYLLKDRKLLLKIIKDNLLFLALFIVFFFILISPWLIMYIETQIFEDLPKVEGWSGAIEFSSDLFGYIFPSVYSKYLGAIKQKVAMELQFMRGVFENFSYVGITIIFSAFTYFFWMIRKKEKAFRKKYQALLFVVLSFWTLTLGPFLHIAGRWCAKPLPGVCISIPLPYVIFHYIPFMNNIRSPGRIMAGLLFFAYLLSGLIIEQILKNRSKAFQYLVVSLLSLIFIIDHQFNSSPPSPRELPTQIYEIIRQDHDIVSVYEMPSVMRDGFVYFGDLSSLDFFLTQPRHGKPTLAGYAGRFPGYKTSYYLNDPFLGYFGRLMDKSLDKNPRIDPNDPLDFTEIDLVGAKQSVDFLDIKYIVLNNNKPYAKNAAKHLVDLGYEKDMSEGSYDLWINNSLSDIEILSLQMDRPMFRNMLGMGWSKQENGFIWSGKRSSVLVKVNNPRIMTLELVLESFYINQDLDIYLNKQFVETIHIATSMDSYSVELPELQTGINTMHYIFDNSYRPKDILAGNQDQRQLSAKFKHIELKD
jgi:hypothetical protein